MGAHELFFIKHGMAPSPGMHPEYYSSNGVPIAFKATDEMATHLHGDRVRVADCKGVQFVRWDGPEVADYGRTGAKKAMPGAGNRRFGGG